MQPYQVNQTENYLGITGFTTQAQIEAVIGIPQSNYTLMAGVLVSDKTFHGVPNKYPVRYPAVADIPSIWHLEAFNVIHYCTADPALPEVDDVLYRCGVLPGMGIQLNVPWPAIKKVEQIRNAGVKVIVQINENALRVTGGRPHEFIKLVAPYYGLANYLLFDMSGGRGIPLDAEMLLRYITPIYEQYPHFQLVAAGGLGPDTLCDVLPLMPFKDRLSIDAESRLRTAQDEMQLVQCARYIEAAGRIFDRRVSFAGHK